MKFFNKVNIFYFITLLLWVLFIFFLSSNYGTFKFTFSIFKFILNYISPDISKSGNLVISHYYTRKILHFIIYFILAFLFYRTFLFRRKIKLIYGFLFCFVISLLDELHQFFIPGRNFCFKDIILDLTGVFFLFSIVIFLYYTKNKPKAQKN